MFRLHTEVFQGPPEEILRARLGHNPLNGHNKTQPIGSGCDSPGTEVTEIDDNRRCSVAMLAQASVSLTPPPAGAAALEMAAAAVLGVDPPSRPDVMRLQVWHNNRLTFWNMPTNMVWRAFATMFCKVEKLDPDAVNWHAVCRSEMADSARYEFTVPIDLDMTIADLGIDHWDTIWCTKKMQHLSSSAAGSSRQQQPAAAATSAEQPAASGSAEQPAAAGSSNSEATARHPWPLRSPSADRSPKRPLRSQLADRSPKQRRLPPKARPEQKKEQEPVESKERPKVFPGSTDGRCTFWPLEAEKIFFKMAMELKQTNMSGYTEKFDKKFVELLQWQEGQVALYFVPTIALRQAAVGEFLRAMGITPTEPPAPDFRSKQYR